MRFLIAVDGSDGSFNAVRLANHLLSPAHDRLALYYSSPFIRIKAKDAMQADALESARTSMAEAVFNGARALLEVEYRECTETIVGSQRASHGIVVAANNWAADLIVVGARGLGPVQRLLIGSTSRAVLHESTVPVLVARPPRFPSDSFKVLIAVDDSATCERMNRLLRQFHWPAHTSGKVVNVLPSVFAGEIPHWLEEQARSTDSELLARAWVSEHEAEIKERRDFVRACSLTLPSMLQDRSPLVSEGYVADSLLEHATREQPDLIVVGARIFNPFSRLLGSTSEAILNHADCSVLIVGEREQP